MGSDAIVILTHSDGYLTPKWQQATKIGHFQVHLPPLQSKGEVFVMIIGFINLKVNLITI